MSECRKYPPPELKKRRRGESMPESAPKAKPVLRYDPKVGPNYQPKTLIDTVKYPEYVCTCAEKYNLYSFEYNVNQELGALCSVGSNDVGNWVEDRFECPKQGTLYIAPKEEIDYEKMKPESQQPNFRQNKLNGTQGTGVHVVLRHDSHDSCGNFATTTDLVYRHLPKPLCGPELRYYRTSKHQYYPQPDLMKCFGDLTEWGLRKYKEYEWACTDVSDYTSTVHEDTYRVPRPDQYLPRCERKAKSSSFTKTFLFKMTKSKS